MRYRIIGHDRNTAVLDMLIALLPEEKHELCNEGETDCISELLCEDGFVVAKSEVHRNGTVTKGECIETAPDEGEERKRKISYAVKTALFKALLPVLGNIPPWGSLTGVKPAKPVRIYMGQDKSREDAKNWLTERYFVSPYRAQLCVNAAEAALHTEQSLMSDEVQLYAGIPFCPTKCAYCSFVSNDMVKWGKLIAPYHAALLQEVRAAGQMLSRLGKKVGSVYIGGGTPTTLSAQQLDELIGCIKNNIDLSICREFTVEAGRPETITKEKLQVFAKHGVDRISINPQTMNDKASEGVGRKHTSKDIKDAFALARSVGDFVINMDLIAGLPGDDGEGLLKSVSELVALNPENITIHCLARKKGAPMRFGKTGDVTEEELNVCYNLLAEHGFKPYYLYRQKYSAGGLENVGFCRDDKKSHYNICMMEEIGDVVALGAGGVSKLCFEQGEKIIRISNPKYPVEYIDRAELIAKNKLDLEL